MEADLASSLKAQRARARTTSFSPPRISWLPRSVWRASARRRGSGPRVVDVADVMDEFNYGISSPHAIRAFLDHARRYWSPSPRFVLLAGQGNLDYKDNLGLGGNLVPPLMVGTPSGLFASDNRLADLVGDDGVPEIADRPRSRADGGRAGRLRHEGRDLRGIRRRGLEGSRRCGSPTTPKPLRTSRPMPAAWRRTSPRAMRRRRSTWPTERSRRRGPSS